MAYPAKRVRYGISRLTKYMTVYTDWS
jgi:hypothetical protein